MKYSITCECSKTLLVSATQAGATLTCECGKSVLVPPMSELRRTAGEQPVPLNSIEKIQAMIRNGELPSGDICPHSGEPANAILHLLVQCENTWIKRSSSLEPGTGCLIWIFFGWLPALIVHFMTRTREEHGRESTITLPVRVSSGVRSELMRTRNQRKLAYLLRATPVYTELLKEFPRAKIIPLWK